MVKLLVLDFDGTMTDAEREGAPFRNEYLADLAVLTGRSDDEIQGMASRFEAEVGAKQQEFGWVFEGHIVAPATVDPYLRVMPVARMILDACEAFTNEGERTRLLDGILYKYNYPKTDIAFREGALAALQRLQGSETYIVTNSHIDPVQPKLRVLGGEGGELDWLVKRVHGSAKKYHVDDSFERVDAHLAIPGLSRPVLLRRRLYFEILEQLRIDAGVEWTDLMVVGDIFELDLALPLALGAQVGLVVNEFTPDYEQAFLQSHPAGRLVSSLGEIPPLVDGAN